MKKISLGNGALEVPEIGLGCMRITGLGSTKQRIADISQASDITLTREE